MDAAKFMNSKVVSQDGTLISYYTIGNGPGLVVVHGTLRSATDYEQLAIFLSDTFTVHVADRRGRGESGPQGDKYDLEKEFTDIRAILQHSNSCFLFGHSFGGAVALELSQRYPLKKLALYEPALSIANPLPVNNLPNITAALAKQDYKKAFIAVMQIVSTGEMSAEELQGFVESLSVSPAWPQFCSLLNTAPNEIKTIHDTITDYSKYQTTAVETLIMYGAKSPSTVITEMERLAHMIPVSKTISTPGAGHNGPDMDVPDKVAVLLKEWFI